jgi:hypothetical protein
MRMTERLITGVALGYGADRSDVGTDGTRRDASSLSASVYASARLFDSTFIDASFGYGTLGYDNRRWVSGDGTLVNGRRGGNDWFGAWRRASIPRKWAGAAVGRGGLAILRSLRGVRQTARRYSQPIAADIDGVALLTACRPWRR